jgi:hypothetical protein
MSCHTLHHLNKVDCFEVLGKLVLKRPSKQTMKHQFLDHKKLLCCMQTTFAKTFKTPKNSYLRLPISFELQPFVEVGLNSATVLMENACKRSWLLLANRGAKNAHKIKSYECLNLIMEVFQQANRS